MAKPNDQLSSENQPDRADAFIFDGSAEMISWPTEDAVPSKIPATPDEAIKFNLFSHFSAESAVTLLVGPDEQNMVAHSSQLTRDSKFFAAALDKQWKEGQTRTIKLPEENTSTMAHYLAFLYSDKLSTEDIIFVPGEQIKQCYCLLAHLYVSGERFLNRHIQVAVLKEIHRLTLSADPKRNCWYPTGEEVNIIYRGTPEGSPARRLFVDLHVNMGAEEWMDCDLEAQFAIDVAKSFFSKISANHTIKKSLAKRLNIADYL